MNDTQSSDQETLSSSFFSFFWWLLLQFLWMPEKNIAPEVHLMGIIPRKGLIGDNSQQPIEIKIPLGPAGAPQASSEGTPRGSPGFQQGPSGFYFPYPGLLRCG